MAEKETKKLNVYIPDTKEGRAILIRAIDYYFPSGEFIKNEV